MFCAFVVKDLGNEKVIDYRLFDLLTIKDVTGVSI